MGLSSIISPFLFYPPPSQLGFAFRVRTLSLLTLAAPPPPFLVLRRRGRELADADGRRAECAARAPALTDRAGQVHSRGHVRDTRLCRPAARPFARLATLLGDIEARQGADQPGDGRSRPGRCRISSTKRWHARRRQLRQLSRHHRHARIGAQAAAGWLNRRFGLNGAHRSGKACPAAERHARRPVLGAVSA